MNENHLQRSSLRKLFQNGCKSNKNDYSERKENQGTIFTEVSAFNGANLLVFVFFNNFKSWIYTFFSKGASDSDAVSF